jgi:hypothetical protein
MKEKEAPTRRSDREEFDDSDRTVLDGMSTAGAAADEAETMASIGNSEGTFTEIATGTATGLGLDRGAAIGTGGLAAGEDLDVVAEGDYWRQNFRRQAYSEARGPYEHYAPGDSIQEEDSGRPQREPMDVEDELERSWDARHGEHAQLRDEKE